MFSRPPWITDLPTGRACGHPVVPTGASVVHRSPAYAFGLTRSRLPGAASCPAPTGSARWPHPQTI